jgi:hypothetical protein
MLLKAHVMSTGAGIVGLIYPALEAMMSANWIQFQPGMSVSDIVAPPVKTDFHLI